MNRLPAGMGRGVSGGCQGRGRGSAALAAGFVGLFLSGTLSACGLLEPDGPKTGPGLDPPGGDGPASVRTGMAGSASFGNGQVPMSQGPKGAAGGSSLGSGGAAAVTAAGSGGSTIGAASPGADAGMGAPPSLPCAVARIPTQLGVHVALDESLSMMVPVDTWNPLAAALDAWIADEPSTQLEVQMFAGACDADAYSEPTLALAPASEQRQALGSRMSASTHEIGAATSTALQSVVGNAQRWAQSGAGNAAVVLISSSEPMVCGDADVTIGAVMGLSGTPAVPTYVLALQALPNLDRIAQAGGTGRARSVADATSAQALLEAMQAITDEARCRYALSEDALRYAPDQITLAVTVNGTTTLVSRVDGAEQCDTATDGFYYDDPVAPHFMIACAQTCARGGSVEIVLGCTANSR